MRNRRKFIPKNGISTAIRILAVVMIALFVVPSFTVSCGAQHFEISGVRLLTGMEINPELTMGANLGVLILLCIPVGIMVSWCVYKEKDIKDAALITMILAAIGAVGWFVVLCGMVIFTEKYNGDLTVKPIFILNLLCYCAVFALSVRQYLKRGR